jgi:hypothetical protein
MMMVLFLVTRIQSPELNPAIASMKEIRSAPRTAVETSIPIYITHFDRAKPVPRRTRYHILNRLNRLAAARITDPTMTGTELLAGRIPIEFERS